MNVEETSRGFAETLHERHSDYWHKIVHSEQWQRVFKSWFDETTADYWRHHRMYEAADYLAQFDKATWLTIGDGQFGLDSVRLKKRGASAVLPTDIGGAALRAAKEQGIISDYQVENAEALSFADETFDFVFCKEALHHFPRPFLALYEMLRVSKKGVVLVEPHDRRNAIADNIAYLVKRLLKRQRHFDEKRYEDSGNYVYSISRREIEKTCLGLNLPCAIFKGITDWYIAGGEFEPATYSSAKFLRMRAAVVLNDFLTKVGLSQQNVLMCCLLKVELPTAIRHGFRSNGWQIVDLPRNPYLGQLRDTPRAPC